MTKIVNILSIALLIAANIFSAESQKLSSYEGLHFYVGFMQNELVRVNQTVPVEQRIFISSQKAARVRITFPYENYTQTVTITPNEIFDLTVNEIYQLTTSESVHFNRLIYIESDIPITIYAFSSQEKTSDAYSVIPISYWGNRYRVITVPNDSYTDPTEIKYDTPRQGQFAVMAHEDNTEVYITPAYETEKGKPAKEEFMITLNKGECYFVQSKNESRGLADLTGTLIRSDKKIGVLSGHVRASIPVGVEKDLDSKDHLIEMLMPKKSWGRKFVSVPFGVNSQGDYFKVVSDVPNVEITQSTSGGDITRTTNIDNYQTIFEKVNEPAIWTSSEPVEIAQFMMRTEVVDDISFADYDPSLVMIVPTEQFISYVNFHTPGNSSVHNPGQYKHHYVLLVAEQEALSSLLLDEQLVVNFTDIEQNRILNSDYYWAKIKLSRGVHQLSANEGRFSGLLFGVGRFDSYAFVLGAALNKPGSTDNLPPELDYNVNCFEINGTISESISDNSYGISHLEFPKDSTFNFETDFDDITPTSESIGFWARVIDPFKDGKLTFDYYDKNGNNRRFRYFYNAIDIDYPSSIDVGIVDWKDSLCFNAIVTNNGKTDQTIEGIEILGDGRLSAYSSDLPIELKAGAAKTIRVCVDPENVDGAINATLKVDVGCDIVFDIPVTGDVIGTGLDVSGYDFGDVRVGDSKCDEITITNNGNVSIEITAIDETNLSSEFVIDQSSLPDTLQPGEKHFIPVCFYPAERGEVSSSVRVQNQYNITKIAELTGNGLAPELNDVVYDFGEKRVGTETTYTIEIVNSGDADISVSFDEFEIKSINGEDQISQALSGIKDVTIPSKGSLPIELTFSPADTMDYILKANFTTDWSNIPNVSVSIFGKGTIPVITTLDFQFEDTFVYQIRNEVVELIKSEGNENLSIMSASIIGGDEQSFNFDITLFDNLTVPQGESFELPVEFAPQRLGYHEVIIEIMHDANPDYEVSPDTVVISGIGIADQNTGIEFSYTNDELFKCQLGNIEIKLKNIQDSPIDITDFRLLSVSESDVFEFTSNLETLLPVKLESGEEIIINAFVIPVNDEIELTFEATLFDEIQTEYKINIPVGSLKNEISDISTFTTRIGSNFDLKIEGEFPAETNGIAIKPELELHISKYDFFLNTSNFVIELTDADGNTQNLNMEQTSSTIDKMIFVSEEEIQLGSTTKFSINFNFMGLLSSNQESEISAIISSNNCFISDTSDFLIKFEEICNFNLRNVKLITNLPNINISPNPIVEKINLILDLPEESDVEVKLIDGLGRRYELKSKSKILAGYHELELPIGGISSGAYCASVTVGNFVYNTLIIVSK